MTVKRRYCDDADSLAGEEVMQVTEHFDGEQLKRFHIWDDKGHLKSINHYEIAEDIKRTHRLFTVGGVFWEYFGGVYREDASGAKVKSYIKERIYPHLRKALPINQIFTLLRDDAELEKRFEDLNDYCDRWIPFADTLLDPVDYETIPYQPEHFCTNRLPWRWTDCKDAKNGTEVEKFLDFAIPDAQDRETLLEYFGLAFNRDVGFQMALIICGRGGSGKSTLLRLLQCALGDDNYANVGLNEFDQRFLPGMLRGKLADICADLSGRALSEDATRALKLITGEDKILFEQKGKDGYYFTPNVKLVFSSNSPPQILNERSNAIARRLLILRLDSIPDKPDPNLFEKLKDELPYFIRLCVEAANRLYRRGTFDSPNSRSEVEQLQKDSDSTEAFLLDCCTRKGGERTERRKLYSAYEDYCDSEERQALSPTAFYKALEAKGFYRQKSGERYIVGIMLGRPAHLGSFSDGDGFQKLDEEAQQTLPF